MSAKLRGTVVPLVTPLQADHSVCEQSVQNLIASVASSASALLPCLSSGEGAKLSCRQWREMVVYTLRHSHGLPVFPGALVETRGELLKRAAFASEAGAAGITVLVPSFDDNDAGGIINYFSDLLPMLPLPVFLYNQESDSADELIVEALTAVCRMDRVVAVKESSRRPEIVSALQSRELPSSVFQGWEDLCYQAPSADGNALALSNLEPGLCAEMHRAPTEEKQKSITALCEKYKLFDEAWYVPLKTELWKRGVLATSLAVA